MYVHGVLVVQYALVPSQNCNSDVPTIYYVLLMQKNELEFSNEYMYNVMQCVVVGLYSSYSYSPPLDMS
jgi:hypothetical protein